MRLSQKVAFNTLVQIIAKVITVFFGLLTIVILIRYLGKEAYGQYMYVITLVVLFGSIADWGTATIGVREASKETQKQNRDKVLLNIFLLRIFFALGAAILMILSAFWLPIKGNQEWVIRQGVIFGSLILILFAIRASLAMIFQTKLQMQKTAIAEITGSVLVFLISWLFVFYQLGLIPLILAVFLANLVSVILLLILTRQVIKLRLVWQGKLIKKFLGESLPMGAILMMFTIDNKIDTVMLGSLKGSGAVGIYALSYRIYDVLILGAAYLMNALLPVLSQYSDLKLWREKIKRIYQKSFDVLLLMGIVVLIFVLIFSPLIIKVITQNRFAEFFDAVMVLRLLSLAIFFSYFNHLTGYTVVALGRQRLYFFVAFFALAFNIITNFLVIPRFSYFGAAVTTILTEGLVLLITTFFVFRLIGFVPSLTNVFKTVKQLISKKGRIF